MNKNFPDANNKNFPDANNKPTTERSTSVEAASSSSLENSKNDNIWNNNSNNNNNNNINDLSIVSQPSLFLTLSALKNENIDETLILTDVVCLGHFLYILVETTIITTKEGNSNRRLRW